MHLAGGHYVSFLPKTNNLRAYRGGDKKVNSQQIGQRIHPDPAFGGRRD